MIMEFRKMKKKQLLEFPYIFYDSDNVISYEVKIVRHRRKEHNQRETRQNKP
jgi:hypothetical protein